MVDNLSVPLWHQGIVHEACHVQAVQIDDINLKLDLSRPVWEGLKDAFKKVPYLEIFGLGSRMVCRGSLYMAVPFGIQMPL